ncbi:50S ribosomal protein L11 methyltransferase [Stygiobacter electus]|uniref:Ribosomal protein L11 methyltransferase n=1 Tax=Stygiobacter electus TaxID=3032292 RepID=A0AAE3TBT0_9BACT|nr:50S ribosomal protein L11 methyltransferase [Stygiobacter electus]MDF1611175.1 50S ribosomal protein L11 methyltransferase [Stygiobacter electus]
MKTYKEIKIKTEPFDVDLLSGFLWQLDIDGINEFDDYLLVFISENKSVSLEEINLLMEKLVEDKFINSFDIEFQTLEEKNWNEEYEKNVKVVEVTEKIVIKPSFKEYNPKPNQLVITIDPKMSFGTGDHATTKLILSHLEKIVKGNEFVLDVGSGTGILGITAVKLGAAKAICIDNDEWCYLNGNENVKMNELNEKVDVRLCEIKDVEEKDFDLILANINKPILINIVDDLKIKFKKEGTLILSGLLNIDEIDIISLYESKGFVLNDKSQLEEWIALVFKTNS